ncbi:MAG: MarR family transcriptional regulator [Alphaproteobacteria bacterium]|nr:MarR family transcriptional regulator [Alphaproteobacteria bacterium]
MAPNNPILCATTEALPRMPGHLIRRLQQIAVAIFLEDTASFGITPVQYAALLSLNDHPGVDQRTLAALVGLDASTLGGVVDRLETRGWLQRQPSPTDRRVKLLNISPEGRRLLQDMASSIEASQQRILAPLPAVKQAQFMAMLAELVDKNNTLSRAPIPGED